MTEKLPVRKVRVYDESFKRKVIEEYLATGCTKRSLAVKYHIHRKGVIQAWMRQMGYTQRDEARHNFVERKSILLERDNKEGKPAAEESPAELSKRIKELEQRLEDEQLLREMYEKMIKVAEGQFKIDIRKKRNTR